MDQLLLEPSYLDTLLDEYAEGLCSQQEEAWVEHYMSNIDMPIEYKMYASTFKNVESKTTDSIDEVPDEEVLNSPNYSNEYLKYSATLKAIKAPERLASFNVINISVEELLEKSENNTLSEKEQKWFDALIKYQEHDDIYQEYIDSLRSQKYAKNSIIKDLTPVSKDTNGVVNEPGKVIPLGKRLIGIAAAIGLFIVGFIGIQNMTQKPAQTAEIIEINDPEEALEVTLAALSMVGRKLNTGQQEISKIKHLGKTNIFK